MSKSTLPAPGYVFRASRLDARAPEIVCYTVDTYHRVYSYRGTRVVDGTLCHVWRVRPAKPNATALEYRGVETDVSPWTFRPYYIFSLHAFETE